VTADGDTAEGDAASVPSRVLRQAARSPGQLALADSAATLTYAALVERARGWRAALARYLPPDPEAVVAVLRPRGVDLPASQLGVWLAAAAYLPLAPGLPAGRIAEILADAGCATAITTDQLARLLPATVTAITAPAPASALALATQTPSSWDARSLAYVIYTSGSAGRPKGVAVEHGSLARLIDWYCPAFAIGPGARTGLFMGLGFDASVMDTWAPLAAGAQLHIPVESAIRDVEAVSAAIAQGRLTHCHLSTPIAELLLASGTCPSCLRTLALGGDRLRMWPPAGFPAAVHNLYGPTEGTVISTASADLRGHPARAAGGLPPIGRPVGATLVELRDSAGRVISGSGESGELWIGGGSLARGYYRAPSMTAAAFTGPADGERWYASGDECAWTSDGELEYLGRRDSQVQLRGNRIELGEVESALLRVPGVQQAAAGLLGDGNDAALAAWIVGSADIATVRSRLAERFPDYMVPSRISVLADLPLTINGKIDRGILADAARAAADSPPGAADGTAPVSETEQAIAEAWREVLGLAPSRESDFFTLGGHSLSANQVTIRLRSRFGISLPVDALFDNPRLSEYAAAVDSVRRSGPVQRLSRDGERTVSEPGRLTLLVVYGRGSATPRGIVAAARGTADVVFLANTSSPQAGELVGLPAGVNVMDIGGMSDPEVCRLAAALRPAGIVTFSDARLRLTAAIARRCGLPFHAPATADALIDKLRQRRALSAHGVQSTGCVAVRQAGDVPAALSEVGLPAVLKPRGGSGSFRTCLVTSEAETIAMLTEFLDAAPAGPRDYILEEYLPGDPGAIGEFWGDYVSVESVVCAGEPTCLAITGRLPQLPPFRDTGLFMPALLDPGQASACLRLERASLAALGIAHGLTHTELKFTPSGPRVIEVNGRMGGHIADALHRSAGLDLLGIAVRTALGESVTRTEPVFRRVTFQYFLAAPSDQVRPGRPAVLDELAAVPGVDAVDAQVPAQWRPDWRAGTEWNLGTVYGSAGDHDELRETLARIYELLSGFWIS